METATSKSSSKSKLLNIKGYKPEGESLPQRMAHYLDWAASEFPKQYTPYNLLVKAVFGYKHLPKVGSQQVDVVRRGMGRARLLLQTKYNRTTDSQPGLGVRATVDSADSLTVAMPKKVTRLRGARAAMMSTWNLVDLSKVPNTPELKPWKDWGSKNVSEIVKLIGSADFEKKMLPPSKHEEK